MERNLRASRQGRKDHGDTHDVYSLTYMLENGIIVSHWGEDSFAELGYMGKAWINSNLAVLFGRESGIRQTKVTMEELLKENREIEFNTSGLKD